MSNAKETILQYGSTKGQTGATERAKRVSVVTSIYSHSQSSNDISRLGVNVGSPLQSVDKQQLVNSRLRFTSGGDLSARTNVYTAVTNSVTTTTSTAGISGSARRLLPSPASNKVTQNSKKHIICFQFLC